MVQECAVLLPLTVILNVVPYLNRLGAFRSEICISQPLFSVDDMRACLQSFSAGTAVSYQSLGHPT